MPPLTSPGKVLVDDRVQAGQEIRALTGVRGVAAIYVMLFHYVLGQPFTNPATTFLAHGYLAVDLFFVLSGFVMALNYGFMFKAGWSMAAYVKFLGRRVARVYPLYFVMTLIGGVLVAIGASEHPSLPISLALPLNLLMVQAWGLTGSLDGPGWSISAEWAAYLLFPALLTPCLFRRPLWAWLTGAFCVLTMAALCVVPQAWAHRMSDATMLDLHVAETGLPVVRCLAEFAFGLLMFRVSGTALGSAVAKSRWIAAVLCLAIVLLMMVPRTDFAVVLLFPVLVLSLTSARHAPGRLLGSPAAEFVGRLSYSIYLTHDLVGGSLGWVHGVVDGLGMRHAQSVVAVLGVLLTLPCAYLAYRFIEVPGRRWLRAVFEGTRPAPIAAEPSAP